MSGRCINLLSCNPTAAQARVDTRVDVRENAREDARGTALGVIATISGHPIYILRYPETPTDIWSAIGPLQLC